MQRTAENMRMGVYAWLFSPGKSHSIFLGLPEEDTGKQERVPGASEAWRALTLEQYGLISGGVDAGEDLIPAVLREAQEERALSIAAGRISNGYPQFVVEQIRPEKAGVVAFNVIGHQLELSADELNALQEVCPTLVVAQLGLADFIAKEGAQLLRPFVYVAGLKVLKEQLHLAR